MPVGAPQPTLLPTPTPKLTPTPKPTPTRAQPGASHLPGTWRSAHLTVTGAGTPATPPLHGHQHLPLQLPSRPPASDTLLTSSRLFLPLPHPPSMLTGSFLAPPPAPGSVSASSPLSSPLPFPFLMSSINSRLKNFGFGKRKSTASIQTVDGVLPSNTPPPGQIPQSNAAGLAPLTSSASTTSLPMNHPGAGNRPPSYTANYAPGPPGPPGGQPPIGRTSPLTNQGPNRTPPSQMVGGPPPINTGTPLGYPPNMAPGMGGGGPPPMGHQQPPQGYPPAGYPPGHPPPPAGGPIAQQFGQSRAEVEGSSQSKAQLIVGIDFVSF